MEELTVENESLQPSFANPTTDLCLHLAEAGLTLRDIQSCSRVSRAWHQTWTAAIRERPFFFLKLFFPGRSKKKKSASSEDSAQAIEKNRLGLSHEEMQDARHELFKRRMRERLECVLDNRELAIVPMGVPKEGLPPPGQSVPFLQGEIISSPLHRSFGGRSPADLHYHNGLVAWELDEDYLVVDNLRERTWQVLPLTKQWEHSWRYDCPRINCLSNDILVATSSSVRGDVVKKEDAVRPRDVHNSVSTEVIVYNLHTGAQITFRHTEILRPTDQDVTLHAIGHDVVTLCAYSRRIVRYRMNWRPTPFNAGNGESLKVNEIQLPHPNISHIFFDVGEKNTDTIFAVTHGKKKVVIYEYLHDTLVDEHRGCSETSEDLQYLKIGVEERLNRKVDSTGTIELFQLERCWMEKNRYIRSSFFFNIPTKTFHWREHTDHSLSSRRWRGWNYKLRLCRPTPPFIHRPRNWFRAKVLAARCSAPMERYEDELDGYKRDIMYHMSSRAVSSLLYRHGRDTWKSKIFVDDEFVVFTRSENKGWYCVLRRKGEEGGKGEVMLHRGEAPKALKFGDVKGALPCGELDIDDLRGMFLDGERPDSVEGNSSE